MTDLTLETEIFIEAEADRIFDYFTDPELMIRWGGSRAELVPEPGGLYRVEMPDDQVMRGEYLEITRPARLVYSWGWEGSPLIPPGSTRITITLQEQAGGTLVRLRHELLPSPAEIDKHSEGWKYYGSRLKRAVETGDAGPDLAYCENE